MKYFIMVVLAMNSLSANAAKLYFSAQLDDRAANVTVKVGNQECVVRSNEYTNVYISANWIDQGITEKVARCEFNLAPGTYSYDVSITTADKKHYGYVYYWAFDKNPIDNRWVMRTMEVTNRPAEYLKMTAMDTYHPLKKKKPVQATGTLTLR